MDLKYVDAFINRIKFEENSNKSALDLLIDLGAKFQKLKVEILTNKLRLQKYDVKDYYDLLIMLLKDVKPVVDRHHLLIVKFWLEYYKIDFKNVLDRETPQGFITFFSEDDSQILRDNPSSKEFQVAFSKSLCYKFYEKAQMYILESRYEFLNPNLLQQHQQFIFKKYYYNLFFSDNDLINKDNEIGIGVIFYNEVILYSIYILLKNEIEQNLIGLSESKIDFYLNSIENNINNSGLLDYPYSVHSIFEMYNESTDKISELENKDLFYPLSFPRYLPKSNIDLQDFYKLQYGLLKFSKSQLATELLEFIEEVKNKFSFDKEEKDIVEIPSNEIVVEKVVKSQYPDINQNSNHTIFSNDEGLNLFNRIYDELSIVPGKRGDQTRFMAIWEDYSVRDFIFKSATTLTNYIDFLNNEYDTAYNPKSKSKAGRYTEIAKKVYNLHLKEINEKISKPL